MIGVIKMIDSFDFKGFEPFIFCKPFYFEYKFIKDDTNDSYKKCCHF